jgi:hypothetical protein
MSGRGAATRVMKDLQRCWHCDEAEAHLAALALHPVGRAHHPVSGELKKTLRQLARGFAKATRKGGEREELRELTYVALSTYAHVAREAGDPHYQPLFEQRAYEARVEIGAERLEEIRARLR